MSLKLLSDNGFKYLAESKGKLAHIINECCKDSIAGKWLVIEESAARIFIEVRYLEKLERDNLCNRVFSYVDNTLGASQKVRRAGEKNQIIRIEVSWALKEVD